MDFTKYYGKISNSGHDEKGRYTGGIPGDQTKKEWEIKNWYNRPWNCIIRHPNQKVRQLLAELAIEAANNEMIGYNQSNRDSFWRQLQLNYYRPSRIKVPCDSDCSAGVIALTRAVGRLLGISALSSINATYTKNMRTGYYNAGFLILTKPDYLRSPDYLLPGDILLNDDSHTAINLGIGQKAITNNTTSLSKKILWIGQVTATQLNVRTWAGIQNPTLKSIPKIYKGGHIGVCGTVKDKNNQDWYYICINNTIYGFVMSRYIKRIL